MTIFDRFKMKDYIMPALCVTLVLFMTAQLVVITVLGVSFKGVKQYSTEDQSPVQASKPKKSIARTKRPPRQLPDTERFSKVCSACLESKSASKTSNKPRHHPLLNNPTSWPPVENRLYPDMELYNQDGQLTRLSDLSGNVIIVQPVAMGCPLSQAYSGANQNGKAPFKKCFPNSGIVAFSQRMNEYTGLTMKTPGLVFVQILFYNMQNEPPTIDDARQWANHFDLRTSNNQYVLVATPEMVTRKSAMLIPGFQLIDRTFNLRCDSTGILPKRSLYLHFFPTLQNVIGTSNNNQFGAAQAQSLGAI